MLSNTWCERAHSHAKDTRQVLTGQIDIGAQLTSANAIPDRCPGPACGLTNATRFADQADQDSDGMSVLSS